jgi:hypothetical protein
MNEERLLRVADKLEGKGAYAEKGKIPKAEWDMLQWRCGSVGCAIGHCGSDPWFRRRGLTLTGRDGDPGIRGPKVRGISAIFNDGFEAVADFFAISRSNAEHLFHAASYIDVRTIPLIHQYEHMRQVTAAQVAKRIRKFVKDHREAP